MSKLLAFSKNILITVFFGYELIPRAKPRPKEIMVYVLMVWPFRHGYVGILKTPHGFTLIEVANSLRILNIVKDLQQSSRFLKNVLCRLIRVF